VHPRADRGHTRGKKELVGFTTGARESAHDWHNLLLDLKRRGLEVSPELATFGVGRQSTASRQQLTTEGEGENS